jgi:hypothetical protein
MTASTPTRAGLTSLDTRITQALSTLRLARSAGAKAKTCDDVHAEERAEANLNALLDYRYATQQRR